ncbi:hypothetical protein [Candidatus Igneacidithiobacillus taiwanensis]|uniref:helix-turn-helix transcriptional regulator n=1 Tax=Candidatus Igneacidithiobacillus taiwanensis TaxID=1945924 RepID=UPI00289653F1|nr:hypothetical protein [Candidatus Igneacidithiobacillus taiwanensis]
MKNSVPNPRAFRAPEAGAYLGISRSTFLLLVKNGRIPQGKKVSTGCTIWPKEWLDSYLDSVIKEG